MDIKTFCRSTPKRERELIAELAGTTDAYLQQLAGGHRKPSRKLAKKLEEVTDGKLNKMDLLFPRDKHDQSHHHLHD